MPVSMANKQAARKQRSDNPPTSPAPKRKSANADPPPAPKKLRSHASRVRWIGDELLAASPVTTDAALPQPNSLVKVRRKPFLEVEPNRAFEIRVVSVEKKDQAVGFPPERTESKWFVVGKLRDIFWRENPDPEDEGLWYPPGFLVGFWMDHVISED